MMNPEIRDQWVAALESGEYAQANGTLTRVNPEDGAESHCCLGVLTVLGVVAGVSERVKFCESDNSVSYGTATNYTGALPPMSVQQWAGLATDNPEVDYKGDRRTLAELNDSEGLTFPEIAKVIKEQL